MLIDTAGACKFCGGEDLEYYNAQERMLGMGGHFSYSQCRSCGSLQLQTVPKDLSIYYPSDYYSFVGLRESSWPTRVLKILRMRSFLWLGSRWKMPQYGYWLKKVHPGFSARIADVGCGNGQLLHELHAAGYTDLHGFDPFIAKEFQAAIGLTMWKRRIEDTDLTFDLIMMHHSFEHMEDPGAVLASCLDRLNPGGKLLIRCPVADSEVWKTERELWAQLDAPRHLIIPSVEGLRRKAREVGFVLDEVEFDSSDFQFWATELYKRGFSLDESKLGSVLTWDERMAMQKKALRYNQEGKGDQACFYLQKPLKA